MSTDPVIRSRANPLLQRVGAVFAGKEPTMLVLEGDRLVDDAVRAGIELEVVLVASDRAARIADLAGRGQDVRVVEPEVLARVGSVKTSPGIIALAPTPRGIDLGAVRLDPRALLLVVDGIADPGNLGALARSAEAFGVRALVVLSGGASPWNEKALRGSMGSLLRLPVAREVDARACAEVLARRGVRHVRAATRGGRSPREFDWGGPIALWVSGETGETSAGATRFEAVSIPMAIGVESLNVTVATSILLFAANEGGGRAHG